MLWSAGIGRWQSKDSNHNKRKTAIYHSIIMLLDHSSITHPFKTTGKAVIGHCADSLTLESSDVVRT